MIGLVTEIQRFSLHDGPGIRTTVFLKGCNMHCGWCHNPETIRPYAQLHYYERNCIQCYKCVYACPSKAHKKIGGEHRFFPNLCVGCGKCAAICYPGAMVMSGMRMTAEAVMAEIEQDIPYYRDSGGGVTLSGGEVLCQTEFAVELAAACRQKGIPVAIETNLSRPLADFPELMRNVDLVMGDLKLIDDAEHRLLTGLGNGTVLQNIRWLDETGRDYIIRTPLIPGATDSEENIAGIARFLSEMKHIRYYELLNYNPLGESKYKSLVRDNPYAAARPLPANRLENYRKLAEAAGINARTA